MSITLCAASEIPVNTLKFYDVVGESVAILNVDGELYAIRNTCPHTGGPVGAVAEERYFDWGPVVGVGHRGNTPAPSVVAVTR